MSLHPDANDDRRGNLTALRWDAAWIDPAVRRMAEAAAQRAGLSVEAWVERAIRKACGMAEAPRYVAPIAAPAPAPAPGNFSAALNNAKREAPRQPIEPQLRQATRPIAPQKQRPPVADDEPLALTQPLDDRPLTPPRIARRTVPPMPQQPSRSMSVFWAAGVAAVLAIIAVMVVRDPALLQQGRALLAGSDNVQQTKSPPSLATVDAAPLRVSPRLSERRPLAVTMLPPPVETIAADTALDKQAATPMPAPEPPTVAAVPAPAPEPVANAPAPSVAAAPTETATAPVAPKPVQMAALPTPSTSPAPAPTPVATEPEPERDVAAPITVIERPTPTPVVTVTPTKKAQPVAAAPKAAPAPAPIAAAPPPAPVEKPTQLAMAPTAPAPPPAPKDKGADATLSADEKLAADLDVRVKSGDHAAEYRLGILYALGKGVSRDYDYAAKLLRRSAESGLAEAQYDFGVLCDKGLGVPRDSAEAARWYAKAAQQGHPPAALNLGYAYAEGLGVVRNLPEAARWFRRAAEAGLINAQFNLAYMFEQGAGVSKSSVDAYAWYSVAAEKGDHGAQEAVERIAAKMTPRELQTAKSRIKTVKRSVRVQN
jgi:localization factor PodJL